MPIRKMGVSILRIGGVMSSGINLNTTNNGIKLIDSLLSASGSQASKRSQTENFFYTEADEDLLSLSDTARQMIETQQREMEKAKRTVSDMWKSAGIDPDSAASSGNDSWSKLLSIIKDKIEGRLKDSGQAVAFDPNDAIAKLAEQRAELFARATQATRDSAVESSNYSSSMKH
jgi:hypothetical protein